MQLEGLEPLHYEDIKAVVAPGIGPKSVGTFEKQAPAQTLDQPAVTEVLELEETLVLLVNEM